MVYCCKILYKTSSTTQELTCSFNLLSKQKHLCLTSLKPEYQKPFLFWGTLMAHDSSEEGVHFSAGYCLNEANYFRHF